MYRNFINMGCNYADNEGNLVRTICRAFTQSGNAMIAYANIGSNGCVGDTYIIGEAAFKKKYRAV